MMSGRQTTLLGLWHSSSKSGDEQSTSLGASKRSRDDNTTPPTVAPSLRLRHGASPRWENISLGPNGPMLLLRGGIGGKKVSERKTTRESLAYLPNWNDNVTFKIFGKECRMRRRICQFSTGGKLSYSYSGLKNVVAPEFPQVLYGIKMQVEVLICDYLLGRTKDGEATSKKNHSTISPEFIEVIKSIKHGDGELYNYCLVNHYRSGEEYMGYHADDEATLDPEAPIASVSLGVSRNFDIRPKQKDANNKRARVARIALGDGDLLLMLSPMQNHFEHAIPVEKRVAGERINLTFRRIATSKNASLK